MEVITPEGELFWQGGHNEQDAKDSFGEDISIFYYIANGISSKEKQL